MSRFLPPIALVLLSGCPDCPVTGPDRATDINVGDTRLRNVYVDEADLTLEVTALKGDSATAYFEDTGNEFLDKPKKGSRTNVAITCHKPGWTQFRIAEAGGNSVAGCEKQQQFHVLCHAVPETTHTTETTTPTSPTPPTEIPPGTHDCTVDGDGCLVGDGPSHCTFVADQTVSGSASVTLVGTATDHSYGSNIDIGVFASDAPQFPTPACTVFRSYNLLESVITDANTTQVEIGDSPVGPGEIDLEVTCDVDNTVGTAQMQVDATGVTTSPLQATGMPISNEEQVVLALYNARVCGLAIR